MLLSSAYVFFFSPSHWCLVPWFTETKPSRPSSHSTWRSWPPPNRRRVQSSRRRPRMLPRQGGDGGASWDTSWLDEVSKQNKKKNPTPPTVSVIREVPPGGCVAYTCAWLWFSCTLRVGDGFKDEWESVFSISLQAASKGSWSSPTWPWLVFLFVFVRVCLGSRLALTFHQVALIILFFFLALQSVK